jgi:succinoglycan biosynthesis transport protein ExoP
MTTTLTQFISILLARWKSAVAVFLGIVILVIGVSYLLPRKYTATAALVVDMRSTDPIAGLGMLNGMPLGYIATQADIIQSDRVALRVVKDLKLTDDPAMRDLWMEDTKGGGAFDYWVAHFLQLKLDVKPSRESSVINVSYTSPDPKLSANLANAFVQAYLNTTLDLRVDPAKEYSTFFDSRGKELRDALEKAQTKLTTYQRQNGIIGNDERYDVESARLNELSSQLVIQQALSADSNSRQMQAKSSANQLAEVINNPVVSGLRADVSRQEAKLRELDSRYGEAHPQVLELKANIAEMRARLQQETARVSSSLGVSNTINQSREGDVRSALESQRSKVIKLKQLRDEASLLQRDVDAAQRAYDAVTSRLTQTSLESQTKQTNTALLNAATEPTRHSFPNMTLNAILAIFVGAMFGVGTALVREVRDRRLRNVQDVIQVLGIPVLGNFPGPMRGPLLGKPHFVLPKQVLARRAAPQLEGRT